jgi:hypothetical protein
MYPIFTLSAGQIEPGADVEIHRLKNGDQIPAILVGMRGPRCVLGVVPVKGDLLRAGSRIYGAEIGKTYNGNPRLIEAPRHRDPNAAVVVLRTPLGLHGGNAHTGDRIPNSYNYLGMPGEPLTRGVVADGKAWGEQWIYLVPRGVVFRTAYSGGYGGALSHYYVFDGRDVFTRI